MRYPLPAAFCALVATCGLATAQDQPPEADAPNRLQLKTERIVVFKDGHCLLIRSGIARSNDAGEVFTEEVPDSAVLGSFWATPDRGRLRAMTASVASVEETTTEEVACAQYLELLAANEGKSATIELEDGKVVRGTIRGALTTAQDQPTHSTGYRSPWQPVAPTTSAIEILTGSLFAVTTDEGDIALPVARVRGLTIRDMALTRRRVTTTRSARKRLTFRFEGGAAERSLRLLYFRPGVRWIPTYRIGLDGRSGAEKRATMRLQAEILNEAEDLVDVPVDLVVGVPNFRFKDTVSPFVLEQTLQDALAQAAPQLMGQQMLGGGSNAFSNRAGEWRGPSDLPRGASVGSVDLAGEISADRNQDLFVYSLPSLTLRRGERAAVPVFESQVAYRDVYTWDVHLQRRDVEAAPGGKGVSPLTLSANRIWHQVELTNDTDVPWTTGAAFLLDGAQPLGQELLTYTGAGGRVRVPITVAIDLRGDVDEREAGRTMNALEWMRNRYARIDKSARLTITSFKQNAVDVEIVCRLGGRADAATHDGAIVLGAFEKGDWVNYLGHPAVNNHSEVAFTLRLPPGEAVTPEIEFHYFTRH
jgi:hypothetical protein